MKSRIANYLKDQHLALLCLCLVIGGGTAYAAGLAKDSVKSKNIKDGQVKTPDLAKDSVSADKLKGIAGLTARQVFLSDVNPDGVAETSEPVKYAPFSLTASCNQTPPGTYTASVSIQGTDGQMAVFSQAQGGANNPSVSAPTPATLVQITSASNSTVRSGSFGAMTDNGAATDSIAGNVTAVTELAGAGGCSFAISANAFG